MTSARTGITAAAVADVHYGTDSSGRLRDAFEGLEDRADLLLIAGDVTRHGHPDEAALLAEDLRATRLPIVMVLGNHDYHCDQEDRITAIMEDAGATVLEGSHTTIEVAGRRVGIAGTKGFGGGFMGASGADFGEREMKAFIRHTAALSERLAEALARVDDADHTVALLHYSPVEETLRGERLEIYPFLGSYLLAEAVDSVGADLVLHGHAHVGREKGTTAGGVPVRNVSMSIIQEPYRLYTLGEEGSVEKARDAQNEKDEDAGQAPTEGIGDDNVEDEQSERAEK